MLVAGGARGDAAIKRPRRVVDIKAPAYAKELRALKWDVDASIEKCDSDRLDSPSVDESVGGTSWLLLFPLTHLHGPDASGSLIAYQWGPEGCRPLARPTAGPRRWWGFRGLTAGRHVWNSRLGRGAADLAGAPLRAPRDGVGKCCQGRQWRNVGSGAPNTSYNLSYVQFHVNYRLLMGAVPTNASFTTLVNAEISPAGLLSLFQICSNLTNILSQPPNCMPARALSSPPRHDTPRALQQVGLPHAGTPYQRAGALAAAGRRPQIEPEGDYLLAIGPATLPPPVGVDNQEA